MYYVSRGNVPHKRHTQHRAPDGSLYAEELFGMEGFHGRSSLLYHLRPPTETHRVEPVAEVRLQAADGDAHHHRLVDSSGLEPRGDIVSGRVPLFYNSDVLMGVIRPAEALPADRFYRNGEADELLFFHQGSGTFESNFGSLTYGPGDYLVIPIGTTWRLEPDADAEHRILYLESPTEIVSPKRYRNDWGQLLEHSPYSNRDLRAPDETPPRDEEGEFEVHLKVRGKMTAYHYRRHPFDVVGWDGYVYPYTFNILDFEPKSGLLHQPPPAHQQFEGPNFVICSFCPRKLDWHPDAVTVPYHHSNVQSEEMLYYVDGNFSSRKGVDIGAITLHPSGLPHGPQPGAAEAMLGVEYTNELAVMCDTFRPLKLTPLSRELDDPSYAYSWNPDRHGAAGPAVTFVT